MQTATRRPPPATSRGAAPLRQAPARRRAPPPPTTRAAAASGGGDASPPPARDPPPLRKLDAQGEAEWRRIDKKVNKYPAAREFKAIGADELGADGSTFAAAMTRCVTSVVGPVHVECVSTSPSRTGAYVAVRIGPVYVHSPEQVIEIFKNFQSDARCKFCM
jgi:putative lipoic acid-binding regulatory protein